MIVKHKYLILLICFLLFKSVNSFAQSEKYLSAFNYIKKLNCKEQIITVDTLINISLLDFYKELSSKVNKNTDFNLKVLDSIDRVKYNSKQAVLNLKNLRCKGTKPGKLIYFSNIYDNMLVAEIFIENRNVKNLNYNSQVGFNQSRKYLFIFTRNHKIKEVFCKLVQYN